MWKLWEKAEVYSGFGLADLRERGHLEDLGADGRIILKPIINK
jgi:hypothetical protein